MKIKALLLLAVTALVMSVSVLTAGAEEADGWTYELCEYGDVSGISVTKYSGADTDVYIPSRLKIKADDAEYPVIKLGEELFSENTQINSVTLSSEVRVIGERAFAGAENMVCIVTNDKLSEIGVGAFDGCSAFNSVILGDAVSTIGVGAFSGCGILKIYCNENSAAHTYAVENGIEYVILNPDAEPETYEQDGITYYIMNGEAVLMSCDKEKTGEVTVPALVEGYPVTKVNASAFEGCTKITAAALPDTVSEIGERAFCSCIGLTSFEFPPNVKVLNQSVLGSCSQLKNVNIPFGVTEIQNSAFSYCSSLTDIVIPESVITIGNDAFSNCDSLVDIKLPTSVKEIGGSAFYSCTSLIAIELSPNITKIDYGTFSNCTSLTDITIPYGVTYIGDDVFTECTNLKEIVIPGSVKTIRDAFSSCTSLTKITMEEGLEVMSCTFRYCDELEEIIIPSTVNEMQKYLIPKFNHLGKATFYVNNGSYAHNYLTNLGVNCITIESGKKQESYTVDGIDYYIINEKAYVVSCNKTTEGTVIIPPQINGYNVAGIRANSFKSCSAITSVVLPENISYIGYYAFAWCTALQDINIPDSVIKIDDGAFYDCRELTEINIPESVTVISSNMFNNCMKLSKIKLHDKITTIGAFAFDSCSSLTEIKIPDSVIEIGSMAFFNCDGITSFTFPKNIKTIQDCLSGCRNLSYVYIPYGAQKIEYYAFWNCLALKSLSIPSTVTNISTDAFPDRITLYVDEDSYAKQYAVDNNILYLIKGTEAQEYTYDGVTYIIANNTAAIKSCDKEITGAVAVKTEVGGYPVTQIYADAFSGCMIESVYLPDSIVKIGENSFNNCENLKSINIPPHVETIETYTFAFSALEEIEIPESVKSIKEFAFYFNSNLKELTLHEGIENICDSAFAWCGSLKDVQLPDTIKTIEDMAFASCRSLQTINIPSETEIIEKYAFWDCMSLERIEIPDSVRLQESVFAECISLESVKLQSDITKIQRSSFYECKSLKNIVIPDTVTEIEPSAFSGCTSLKTLTIPSAVTQISSDAFSNCPNLILCVYEGSYAHTFAVENNIPYFLLPNTDNPYASNGQGISGTVTSLTGAPKAGVTVELLDSRMNVRETVTTDDAGAYSFTYAEVGAYTLRASDSAGSSGTENVSVKRKSIFDVYLQGNTDITIKDSAGVSGTVTDQNGAVIAGALITLSENDGMGICSATSGSDGKYSISAVPNGTYTVRASADGGASLGEVTVLAANGDVTYDIVINSSVTINGYVTDSDGNAAVWASVTVIDSEGTAVAALNTDKDGFYEISGLPTGTYRICAVIEDIDTKLSGNTVVDAVSARSYTAETIVLTEEKRTDGGAVISGKVTAHGQQQISTVILRDMNMNEIAVSNTLENGKYKFANIADGVYMIIAVTQSEGAGFTVISVSGGAVKGDTSITVYKTGSVESFEAQVDMLPDAAAESGVISASKEDIIKSKNAYDALSDKDKKRVSQDKLNKLNALVEKTAAVEITITAADTGEFTFTAQGLETIVSDGEIGGTDSSSVSITVTGHGAELMDVSDDEQKTMIDTAAEKQEKTVIGYFDISCARSFDSGSKNIKNIKKDTSGTGTVRITAAIPEQYRGHRNYSMLHMHGGQLITLADVDTNPDTITVETDKFSEFALTYDDNVLGYNGVTAAVSYDSAQKKATVISDDAQDALVIFAAYSGDVLISKEIQPISLQVGNNDFTAQSFSEDGADTVKVMVWSAADKISPLTDVWCR